MTQSKKQFKISDYTKKSHHTRIYWATSIVPEYTELPFQIKSVFIGHKVENPLCD